MRLSGVMDMSPKDKSALPLTSEEYWDWKQKLEAGYGQPRPGVSPKEVERERAAIPEGIRRTYIFEKFIAKKK